MRLRNTRADATQRFLQIAAAIKAEAGVRQHYVCKTLTGRAWTSQSIIEAPEGRTSRQLYILAHECGHIALHRGRGKDKPTYLKEFEAEQWAHDALRRHGVPVPPCETERARKQVSLEIYKAKRQGVTIDRAASRFANGGSRTHD